MRIISIESVDEYGRHDYICGELLTVPSTYAIIPKNMIIPPSFPYVDIDVENGIVTKMVGLEVPELPAPPESEPEPDPSPTLDERLNSLESDNNLLKQQLKAASDQNEFLENCIAEMAGIIYA